MAHILDFNKKEPTRIEKAENMIYQLSMNLNTANRMIGLMQKQLLGMARISNITPAQLAQIFHADTENQTYYNNVRQEEQLIIDRDKVEDANKDAIINEMIINKENKPMSEETQTPEVEQEVAAPAVTPEAAPVEPVDEQSAAA